jgi:hypothetical protein
MVVNKQDLEIGMKIQLDLSKEIFIIDRLHDDGTVDMIATVPFRPELAPHVYPRYEMIPLKNYKIIG